jgi:hypothetical protein
VLTVMVLQHSVSLTKLFPTSPVNKTRSYTQLFCLMLCTLP